MIKKFLLSIITFSIIAMPALAQGPIEATKNGFFRFINYKQPLKPVPKVAHQNIAVIPVDIHMVGDIQSIYSNTLTLISRDISNRLNKSNQLTSPNLKFLEDKIKANNLQPELKSFLENYKTKYIIDYKTLRKIALTLGADKVLLVSGDFDTRQFLLKPNLAYLLDIPETSVLKSSYRLQTTATFIDPFSQIILWDKEFAKDFNISNFDIPSINFSNNVVPISEIKKFSKEISPQITRKIFFTLPINRIQSVQSHIISSKNNLTDGITTKDGHSYSAKSSKLQQERKQKYIEWMDENL